MTLVLSSGMFVLFSKWPLKPIWYNLFDTRCAHGFCKYLRHIHPISEKMLQHEVGLYIDTHFCFYCCIIACLRLSNGWRNVMASLYLYKAWEHKSRLVKGPATRLVLQKSLVIVWCACINLLQRTEIEYYLKTINILASNFILSNKCGQKISLWNVLLRSFVML